MTLAQQIVADVPALLLNPKDFAEQVTYYFAAGGPPLLLNAVVDLAIRAEQTEFTKRDVEAIEVTLAADPAGLVGLPLPPAHGDYLQRTGNGDLPTIAYAFVGQSPDQGYGAYTATFERRSLKQVGLTK